MSHKTGKRVLTASTSLALAVVGLAVQPAQAATVGTGNFQWVNGCGTNDSILVDPVDNLTQYSVDGGKTFAAISFKPGVDVNGNKVVDLSGVTGLYDTNPNNAATFHYVIKDVLLASADGTKLVTATAAAAQTDKVSDTACTATIGAAADDIEPVAETDMGGVVVAPTATPNTGTNGGTVQLTKTAGISWTVSDGVTTQTFSSASMGATQNVTVTGSSVTVTASPESNGTNLVPSTAFTWRFTLNGGVAVAPPAAPSYDAAANKATFVASSTSNFRWYVTSASVTDPTVAAQTTPLSTTTAEYQFTAADAGTTKRLWAIPLQGYQFNDGTTFKKWDFSIPAATGVIVDPTQFAFTDTSTTDSVTIPAVSGAKLYYAFSTAALLTKPTFNADGSLATGQGTWTAVPAGQTTTLPVSHPNGEKLYVVAALSDQANSSFAYRPGLVLTSDLATPVTEANVGAQKSVGLISPYPYTTGVVATVPYPSFNDADGGVNDSVTFPDFSNDVAWDVYAYPAGGSADPATLIDPASVNTVMGQTVKRGQFGTLNYDVSGTVNPNQDITFEFVPKSGNSGAAIPGSLDPNRLKGTLYIGSGLTASEPVWIDNSGTTSPDFIKFSETTGVSYTYQIDADNNGVWDAAPGLVTVSGYTNGIKIVDVPAGSKVWVRASGTGLRNADAGTNGTTVTWTHQFTVGNTGVVPSAPTSSDPTGVDSDTYTIPTTTGVDYYVGGAIKAAGTYSTGGARTVSIMAQPKSGYTIAQGATSSWTLPFETGTQLGDVSVGNSIITDADVPTTRYSWSADNATSYTVTYYKVLGNGTFGPELPWLTDTTETSANFVAMAGDEYIIKVTATNDAGETKSASSGVKFEGPTGLTDIYTGIGTFNPAWQMLNNLQSTQNLPYFNDTAALGYTNADWTVTLPAGTKSLDLYATVHAAGAAGKIQVNGLNWADFTTSSSYWGVVSDPYKYPVRTIQGWDSTKPVTIKVIATDAGVKYLALDAFKAHN